jgi:hypothetical protein
MSVALPICAVDNTLAREDKVLVLQQRASP